jgi:precorrin-2 dehydrogenase/sirohydrochlorin ferrochelatase
MSKYPVYMELEGRKCVVIGGGTVAARKVRGLRAAGAEVHVVSPDLAEPLRSQADVHWHEQPYGPELLAGASLVFACTNDEALNARVYEDCRSRSVWCNVADDPQRCDFLVPAVVRRGRLQIAVSTGGASPGLARTIRRELERRFGGEFDGWLQELGQVRRAVIRQVAEPTSRRVLLQKLGGPESLRVFRRDGLAGWVRWCRGVVSAGGGSDDASGRAGGA